MTRVKITCIDPKDPNRRVVGSDTLKFLKDEPRWPRIGQAIDRQLKLGFEVVVEDLFHQE